MGYVRQQKTYRLIFEDPEYAGLEVVSRSASVAAYRRIAGLASGEFSNPPSKEDLAEIDHLFDAFSEVLVSWNLERPVRPDDPDSPVEVVPATADGLWSQDLPFAMAIITAWMDAVMGVSGPLARQWSDGDPALVGSLPMEVLSPGL